MPRITFQPRTHIPSFSEGDPKRKPTERMTNNRARFKVQCKNMNPMHVQIFPENCLHTNKCKQQQQQQNMLLQIQSPTAPMNYFISKHRIDPTAELSIGLLQHKTFHVRTHTHTHTYPRSDMFFFQLVETVGLNFHIDNGASSVPEPQNGRTVARRGISSGQ